MTGEREAVATTSGWDTQMGAHVHWGKDDAELYFNDLDTAKWEPYGVQLDLTTGTRRELCGTVYDVSSNGDRLASPDLLKTRTTQAGYGSIVPDEVIPRNDGTPDDDGLFVTDTETGETELVVSIAKIVDELDIDCSNHGPGDYYGWHTMWCPGADHLLFHLRYWPETGDWTRWVSNLISVRADGSDIQLAMPSEPWQRGGHHHRWSPDGTRVTMNLSPAEGEPIRFVSFNPDGSDLRVLADDIVGSGHPSLHPDGRSLITDAYPWEDMAYDDGTVPIRFVDVEAGTERNALRIPTTPVYTGEGDKRMRVDPHPAWGPDYRFVVFNACPDGHRKVFVADFGDLVGDSSI
ncbi:hypothetical protein C5C07_17455 [Haloferax sp. Atlit-4N]|nr:hypothetical protein C5C07_17455 [Haloferax sp. Atlit-4N]